MYIYISESLCYVPETNTTSLINYISIFKKYKLSVKPHLDWFLLEL